MGIWIKISALSTSVDFALQLGALVIAPQDRTLIAEAISEAAVVFAGLAAAVIMLHALAKLRPKID